jgi:predicted DNA-binding protein
MPQMTFTIPDRLKADLEKIADLRASSLSQEIRTAIVNHINDVADKLDIDTDTLRKIQSAKNK